MTEFSHLQEQFQKFLLSGESDISHLIMQTEFVSINARLAIYRNAYRLRLIECLSANFPSLFVYLGAEQFNQLATAYIEAYPSSYRSIRWYGDVLPDFIKNYYPQYPYLAELADFEWNMSLAFDAADTQIVQVDDMAAVPPEAWASLQFVFHPSLYRSNYIWNAIPLWQALTQDQQLPEMQQNSELKPWVLWRKPGYIIQFYSLSCEEAWGLDQIRQGMSFGGLCEGLCEWINPEDVGMRAASYLKGWIQQGMLAQLKLIE